MTQASSRDEALLLDCRKITKSYNGPQVLCEVDFSMRRGEIHALVGENGAGKSTLIKIITGVTGRNSGEMLFEGRPIGHDHSRHHARHSSDALEEDESNKPFSLTHPVWLCLLHCPRFVRHGRPSRKL